MEQNVVEDLVIPEVPKVIPNQEMYVYVPIATHENKGIANFDSYTLTISNGKVSVKESFVDSKIDNRIVQVTGQNSDKVISQKIITALLEEKASKTEISEIANNAAEETAKSVGTEIATKIAKETAEETVGTVVKNEVKVYVDNNAASSLEFSVNNSTFVLTATLKNAKGEILGTSQTVDLPLESVVVNGTYDNDSKTLVLTLQNGNNVNIPVSNLINGLASIEYLEANASLLKGGTPIAEGTDLNSLTTPGSYYFSYDNQINTLSNCPITSAFTMKVFYSTGGVIPYIKQEIKQYDTNSYLTRHSEDSGSTWSAWETYVTSDEVVFNTGNQPVYGIKTFSDGIKSNKTPAEDNDLVRLTDLNSAISQAITTALNTQV